MTLNEVMKDTADAIREKTGKSEKIAPINFAEEIKSISAGGGSNWRYFDTTKATVTEANMPLIKMIFSIFKEKCDEYTFIVCNTPPFEDWEAKFEVAMATDFNLKIYHPEFTLGEITTIEEFLNGFGGVEALCEELGFTEITEEQFYDLNA